MRSMAAVLALTGAIGAPTPNADIVVRSHAPSRPIGGRQGPVVGRVAREPRDSREKRRAARYRAKLARRRNRGVR